MKVYEIISEEAVNEGPKWDAIKAAGRKVKDFFKKPSNPKRPVKKPTTGKTPPAPKKSLKNLSDEEILSLSLKNASDATKRIASTKWQKVSKGLWLVEVPLLAKTGYDYYVKITEIEDQYKAYLAGDKTTAIFEDLSAEEAREKYSKLMSKAYGELTIIVSGYMAGAVTLPLRISKKLINFADAKLMRAATHGATAPLRKLSNIVHDLAIKGVHVTARGSRITLMAFLQTEAGQELLTNATVEDITGIVGKGVRALTYSVDAILKALGIDILPSVPGLTSNPTGGRGAQDVDTSIPWQLVTKKLPSGEWTIGGVTVTDTSGKLLSGMPNFYQDIANISKAHDVPNPLDKFKK